MTQVEIQTRILELSPIIEEASSRLEELSGAIGVLLKYGIEVPDDLLKAYNQAGIDWGDAAVEQQELLETWPEEGYDINDFWCLEDEENN